MFCFNITGDIGPTLKAKAGIETPPSNKERKSGFDIEPGSDDEATDDEEEEEIDIADLQADKPSAEDNVNHDAAIASSTPGGTYENLLDYISKRFSDILSFDSAEDAMKGSFEHDVVDPDDPNILRTRICVFTTLLSGVNINKVEASREGREITYKGTLTRAAARASTMMGAIGACTTASTNKAFQSFLDEILRASNEGGEFRGIPWSTSVKLKTNLELERDFVDPSTNRRTDDAVFINRVPSLDPEIESDFFVAFSFILAAKKYEGGTPARGDRDRRAQAQYFRGPDQSFASPHVPLSEFWRSPTISEHHQGLGGGPSSSYNQVNSRATTYGGRPNRRGATIASISSHGSHRSDMEWEQHIGAETEALGLGSIPGAVRSVGPARGAGMATSDGRPRPTNDGNLRVAAAEQGKRQARARRNNSSTATITTRSMRSRTDHPNQNVNDDIFHDARANEGGTPTTSSPPRSHGRSKRTRNNYPTSPRRRQQLNDRSVLEESDEVNYSFDDDEGQVLVETVSTEEESL